MIITRTYDTEADANRAVEAVHTVGVDRDDISVVASRDYAGNSDLESDDDTSATGAVAGVGSVVGGGAGLLAGLGLMAIPGAGPLIAAGWLASTAVGAAVGAATGAAAGGIVDAMTSKGIEEKDAHVYAEAVRRGAILVSVQATAANEASVIAALDNHNPADLSIQRDAWVREGWTGYDPDAPNYTPDERQANRTRYIGI